ncbi:hypothetical protein MIR68_002526 [Amoeboaphelidium protococcarum]|nr:hypothetical protein MIR68_002526 [Amoeboaphelidium protococcarum]
MADQQQEFRYLPDGSKVYIKVKQDGQTGSRTATPDIITGRQRERRKRQWMKGDQMPWSQQIDRELFQSQQSEIKYNSAEYYEFQEFYERYLYNLSDDHQGPADVKVKVPPTEMGRVRQCLDLYKEFKMEQLQESRDSIAECRRNLPIYQYKQQIIDMIKENQVCVISAQTAAGKSTQVPQYIREAGFEKIVVTQPRRIAAMSLCKRVQYECMSTLQSEVGFQIRFESDRSEATQILFVTEGILIKQIYGDPLLSQYNVVIIDEVHERHLNCDFLLGVIKLICQKRKDLKVILMSATINAELFQQYFDNAPLIEVPGRLHPVDILYLAPGDQTDDAQLTDRKVVQQRRSQRIPESIPAQNKIFDPNHYLEILKWIESEVPIDESGDLLIFLPGVAEINKLYNKVKQYADENGVWIPLKLHSALSISDQDKVFVQCPPGARKCIISTNIAETSITIDGVRFVIDSGTAREMDYDLQSRLSKLSEFWISQASAKQRAGRAGRTQSGYCFRLYSEEEYDGLNEYTVPEIMRVSLDQVILSMKKMDLGIDPYNFQFVEPPPIDHIDYSLKLLHGVDALDSVGQLTPIGYMLAMLPVDVIIGKMLLMSSVFDVVEPVLIMAAALSLQQSPLLNAADLTPEQVASRSSLYSLHGDPFTLLNVYIQWLSTKHQNSSTTSQKWCKRNGVNEYRLYEISKLVHQYRQILRTYLNVRDKYQRQNTEKRVLQSLMQRQKYASRQSSSSLVQQSAAKEDEGEVGDNQISRQYNENSSDADAELEAEDYHSLEFAYKLNVDKYAQDLNRYDKNTITEESVDILKFVLSSGLYPNIAIPDSGNAARSLQNRVYHSQHRKRLVMHPGGTFAQDNSAFMRLSASTSTVKSDQQQQSVNSNSNLSSMNVEEGNVDLAAMDVDRSQQTDSSYNFSKDEASPYQQQFPNKQAQHEILCYLNVLETRRPYLVNVYKAAALQTLLLFCQSIDTNTALSHVVFDEWIIVSFMNDRRMTSQSIVDVDQLEQDRLNIRECVLKLLQLTAEARTCLQSLTDEKLSQIKINQVYSGASSRQKRSQIDPIPQEMYPYLPQQLLDLHLKSWDKRSKVKLQDLLSVLDRFMAMDVMIERMKVKYSVDILRPQDTDLLYPSDCPSKEVMQVLQQICNPEALKYGYRVTEYLNYGTLQFPLIVSGSDDMDINGSQSQSQTTKKSKRAKANVDTTSQIGQMANSRSAWTCPICCKDYMVQEKFVQKHLVQCQSNQQLQQKQQQQPEMEVGNQQGVFEASSQQQPATTTVPKGCREYQCSSCQQLLYLKPVDILKHKRSCQK